MRSRRDTYSRSPRSAWSHKVAWGPVPVVPEPEPAFDPEPAPEPAPLLEPFDAPDPVPPPAVEFGLRSIKLGTMEASSGSVGKAPATLFGSFGLASVDAKGDGRCGCQFVCKCPGECQEMRSKL